VIDELPQPEATSRRRAGLGCLLELVETLALTLVIFFVVQDFVAQQFQVLSPAGPEIYEGPFAFDRLPPCGGNAPGFGA